MNEDTLQGNWKQFKGKLVEQWGKHDDLTTIDGNRDELEGLLQQHYGYARDKVQSDVDSWLTRM